MTAFDIVSVTLAVEREGVTRHVTIAGGFDPIRAPDQARAAGRAIGDLLADNLERRIRQGHGAWGEAMAEEALGGLTTGEKDAA